MSDLPAYILAGGASSRFGSDKARAVLDGQPLIVRIASGFSRVTVVADAADKYADLGLRTIADRLEGTGPMGGLQAALHDLPDRDEWLLLLSCDLLRVERAWVEALRDAIQPGRLACAFKPDLWQPLLAVYHRAILPEVQSRLSRDERAMWKLLDAVDAHVVTLPDGSTLPPAIQANHPSDLSNRSVPKDQPFRGR